MKQKYSVGYFSPETTKFYGCDRWDFPVPEFIIPQGRENELSEKYKKMALLREKIAYSRQEAIDQSDYRTNAEVNKYISEVIRPEYRVQRQRLAKKLESEISDFRYQNQKTKRDSYESAANTTQYIDKKSELKKLKLEWLSEVLKDAENRNAAFKVISAVCQGDIFREIEMEFPNPAVTEKELAKAITVTKEEFWKTVETLKKEKKIIENVANLIEAWYNLIMEEMSETPAAKKLSEDEKLILSYLQNNQTMKDALLKVAKKENNE